MRAKDTDYDKLRTLLSEWREISYDYYGDFYPLTPYTLKKDDWIAWQFNIPETGRGMMQAFRRDESIFCGAMLRIKGLQPDVHYQVKNLDCSDIPTATGSELMQTGVYVNIPESPGVAVFTYEKIK